MKNALLILFLFLFCEGYAQKLVSSQADAPKYTHLDVINLGENGFITWYAGQGNSAKGKVAQAQYIKDGEQQWVYDLNSDEQYYFKEEASASPDGEWTYFVYGRAKEYDIDGKIRLVQISKEGEVSDMNLELSTKIRNVKATFCDEDFLYFYCLKFQKYLGTKKEFEEFEPILIKYNHISGEVTEVEVELDKVEYEKTHTLWELGDIANDILYFTKSEIYKDQVVVSVCAIDKEGKRVSTSQKAITIDKFSLKALSVSQLWYNNHKGITVEGNFSSSSYVKIEVDASSNRIYFFHQEGSMARPTLTVHLLDLDCKLIKTLQGIEISGSDKHDHSYNSLIIDHKEEGGIYLYTYAKELRIVDLNGEMTSKKLNLEERDKTLYALRQFDKKSPILAYLKSSQAKNVKMPLGDLAFERMIIFSEGSEYLYYYGIKTKAAEVLKF